MNKSDLEGVVKSTYPNIKFHHLQLSSIEMKLVWDGIIHAYAIKEYDSDINMNVGEIIIFAYYLNLDEIKRSMVCMISHIEEINDILLIHFHHIHQTGLKCCQVYNANYKELNAI
jgi:hypothetical protein